LGEASSNSNETIAVSDDDLETEKRFLITSNRIRFSFIEVAADKQEPSASISIYFIDIRLVIPITSRMLQPNEKVKSNSLDEETRLKAHSISSFADSAYLIIFRNVLITC
jgi:hypothetical protein